VGRRLTPAGRGAGASRPHRTYRIPVRFTADELAAARRNAHATGRPLARLMRERALGSAPRTLRLQAQHDVVHELSTIVRELSGATGDEAPNAIARAATALRALLTDLTA
jgi:hypothetical protein